MKTTTKLSNLKYAFLVFCIGVITSSSLQAQSLIDNGDFSGGITYRWSHKDDNNNVTYTDVSGALQAVINPASSVWSKTGIRNSKTNNLSDGDLIRVKFRAQTLDTSTQLRLVLNSQAEGSSYTVIDLIEGADFRDYTFYVTIDSGDASDYKFWLKFLDAGTFKIDDIEVDLVTAVSGNLALSGAITAGDLHENSKTDLNLVKNEVITGYDGIRLAGGGDNWASIGWGTPQPINKVVIYAPDNITSVLLTDYTIQYWDGTEYQDVLDVSNVVSYPVTSTFAQINTSELRILTTGGQYRIDEIEIYNETVLAVDTEEVTKDNFLVYSKPNYLVVSGKTPVKQLEIFSLVGALVYKADGLANTSDISIATDTLAKGIYIVRINAQYSQKIIIQ